MMKKILICDDELDTHLLVKAALERYKLEFFSAKDGDEAVEIVKSNKPDLVIMDYKLPGMDGYETIKEIKKLVQDVPVIFMTGLNIDPEIKQNIDSEVVMYLVKPFDCKELVRAVGEILKIDS